MRSIKVNIRKAKAILSRLINRAQKGDEIILTNRDKPVARIIAINRDSLSLKERIEELELAGAIEPANTQKVNPIPSPLPLTDELAWKYLQEDRNS